MTQTVVRLSAVWHKAHSRFHYLDTVKDVYIEIPLSNEVNVYNDVFTTYERGIVTYKTVNTMLNFRCTSFTNHPPKYHASFSSGKHVTECETSSYFRGDNYSYFIKFGLVVHSLGTRGHFRVVYYYFSIQLSSCNLIYNFFEYSLRRLLIY